MWFSDGSRPPLWIVGAPFLRVLDAWFIGRGMALCHGAAIGKHGGAALIIGPGGAGKSTLAMHSLGASFGYLGDDYVLLEPAAPRPIAHSVYCSGKLFGADIDAGIPAQAAVFRLPDEKEDKSHLRIGVVSTLKSAPLVAVLGSPPNNALQRPRLRSPLKAISFGRRTNGVIDPESQGKTECAVVIVCSGVRWNLDRKAELASSRRKGQSRAHCTCREPFSLSQGRRSHHGWCIWTCEVHKD